jgi:DNA-binding MarR family transcriptional regulator
VERQEDRPDLAAMMHPLLRALIAMELPVLEAHGVTMWGYTVLTALDRAGATVRTQAALAEAIGADRTRIIGTLDDLQAAGLISRTPDPADRRARLLAITEEGQRVRRAVTTAIQEREERLLAELPAGDRRGFLRALRALSARPAEDLARVLAGAGPGGG